MNPRHQFYDFYIFSIIDIPTIIYKINLHIKERVISFIPPTISVFDHIFF